MDSKSLCALLHGEEVSEKDVSETCKHYEGEIAAFHCLAYQVQVPRSSIVTMRFMMMTMVMVMVMVMMAGGEDGMNIDCCNSEKRRNTCRLNTDLREGQPIVIPQL